MSTPRPGDRRAIIELVDGWLTRYAPPYDERALHGRLVRGDCLEAMAREKADSVDLIVTAPLHGVDKPSWDCTKQERDEFTEDTCKWIRQALRLLKPSGRIFVFWTTDWWHLLHSVVQQVDEELGLNLAFSGAILWQHDDTLQRQHDERGMKPNYDPILHWRGPAVQNLRYTDPWRGSYRRGSIWRASSDFGLLHRADRSLSLEIVEGIVDTASYPNALILDPFVGSGTVAIAAERLRRRWIGIDSFSGDEFHDGEAQERYAQMRIILEGHLKRDWHEVLSDPKVPEEFEAEARTTG